MVFPATVLPLSVELLLNGAWTDVTSYVYRRDMVTITRGRSDEASRVGPSMARLTFDDRDGRFYSRNPTGAYYGTIGRNTPLRIGVDHGSVYLRMPGDVGDKATTTDKASLDITGDIDVRIDLSLENWREAADFCGKYVTSGDQRSWALYLVDDGTLYFRWSTSGASGGVLEDHSTLPVPVPGDGRAAVRVTLDVNNGASGHTTTFYTSDTISGTWTQLGDAVVTAGTTSIFSSSAGLEVGDVGNLTGPPVMGKIHAFKLLNGIAGTEVANPVFSSQTAGATSFADTASPSNTWSVAGGASLTSKRYRFCGEVPAWPPRWDTSGTDVYTPVEASGILRRLGQGASPLQSTLYRGLTTLTGSSAPVAYWPCEDSDGATTLASAIGGPPMTITGSPSLASYSSFDASAPIPTLSGSEWSGPVPQYTYTGDATVRFLLAVPSGGATAGEVLVRIFSSGTCVRWDLSYESGGALQLIGYDEDGVQLFASGAVAFGVNGELLRVAVDLDQSGANVGWNILTLQPGATSGLSFSGTLNSRTLGQVTRITVSPGGGLSDVAIGHVSVQSTINSIYDLGAQLEAYAGERAGERIERLCGEEGITFRGRGWLAGSCRMGPQLQKSILDLVTECAEADQGMLFEPRDVLGLGYRTLGYLVNQETHVALDYATADLAGALEPTPDDQLVRNDVTVSKVGGSSARAVLETGALSVQDPPNGASRYAEQTSLSVQCDEYLPDQANWRLHLGTVDEDRYPTITVNLARTAVTGDATLALALRETDVGDRLTMANPPAWLPPDTVSQIIQGYSETLGNYEHELAFNCSPESPYQVAVYDTARYESGYSTLASGVNSSATSLSVATSAGPLWSTSPGGSFDILVAGERMTVTAISGGSSPQTFTVTRSVNGVVKSQSSGATVRLYTPPIRAMAEQSSTPWDRKAGRIVQATDTPRTVWAYDDTPQLNLTSTPYVTGSPEVGVSFVAPSSGRVLVTVGGACRDNTNDNRVFLAPQILLDSSSGTEVLAPSVESYGFAPTGTASNYVTGSRVSLITSLIPGQVYYARVMMSAEITGSTSADIASRDISVEPAS